MHIDHDYLKTELRYLQVSIYQYINIVINNYKSDRNSYLLRAHCQDDC